MRHALITGITGQDGAYLSKLLLEHGYKVYGLDRRTSTPTTERLYYLEVADRVVLLDGDVTDQGSMVRVLERSEEHTSELQSPCNLVCRLLLEKKKKTTSCKYAMPLPP